MNPFQTYLDRPAFISSDDLFADCELYPSEPGPYTKNRTSLIQQQLSWIEHSAKGCSSPSPYTSVNPDATEPFSVYNAHYLPGVDSVAMMAFRPGSSMAYSDSDGFPSPWTGNQPPSLSALDSPRSSALGNIECYMSPKNDDGMFPSLDGCGYPPPEGLASVALPEVQIEPHNESVFHPESELNADNQVLEWFDDAKDEPEQGLGIDIPSEEIIKPDEKSIELPRGSLIKSPSKVNTRASVDRVVKNRPTSSHRRSIRSPPPQRPISKITPKKPKKTVNVTRGRQFVCSFAHYGCESTFCAKNEWKRHVTSQHLQLGFYRCDLDNCNINKKSQDNQHHHKKLRKSHRTSEYDIDDHDTNSLANDFNRKDLFTQHLRRMHAPWVKEDRSAHSTHEQDAFEKSLDGVRDRCWQQQRLPPSHSQCGFCGREFQGVHSWEDRMEHVGRHFERDEALPEAEAEDVQLRAWAIREGIVQETDEGFVLSTLCENI